MTEPASTAISTIAASALAVPALSIFGTPLGLRPDLLIAGFAGGLVAIALLDSVPGSVDTWRNLIQTTRRRISVAVASALTAGYLAPLLPLMSNVPEPLLLCSAFITGACAQQVLRYYIAKFTGKSGSSSDSEGQQ